MAKKAQAVIDLPPEAQASTDAPRVPLRADIHALLHSIAVEHAAPYRAAWAVFVHEYMVDGNAARAATAAGYAPKRAKTQGERLLAAPVISEGLARLRRERHEQLRVEADDVLHNLVRIASFDPRTLVYKGGKKAGQFRGLGDLPDDTAACISGITFNDKGQIRRLTFWSKTTALEILARHLGLLQAPDASAQLPGGVGALLTLLQPAHLAQLSDAEVEAVANVVELAKRIVAQAHAPHRQLTAGQ